MSSYDPYRFLPNQQPPHRSQIEQIHIPIYAAPDLDPSGPLPEAEQVNTRNELRQGMAEGNEAGPSRKRPRDEGSNAMHGHAHASNNGHGQSSRNGQHHNGPAPTASRPVEVPPSMFGFDARNDLTREIGTWLVRTCQDRENIEVSYQISLPGSVLRID